MDDDRTLMEIDDSPGDSSKPAADREDLECVESRMQDLVVRVAALETAMARQQRRDLIILLLLGAYLLTKIGRPFLRN